MLQLDGVTKVFRSGAFGGTPLPAVRGVSFEIRPGEVTALIGESGSGKTTIGKMILRLESVTSGTIRFEGGDIATLKGSRLKEYYRHVQGVFQDPFSSYNPIFRVDRVFELVRSAYFPRLTRAQWRGRVEDVVAGVGLDPLAVLDKFTHQLSGGQLQRLLIARALLLDVKLLVADEIISMLDASTRVDVLNLLASLKSRGLGILFITHDLSLGNYLSERTVILRHGTVLETGATHKVFGNPQHAYTKMLLASVPQLRHRWEALDAEARLTAASASVATKETGSVSAGSSVSASAGNGVAGRQRRFAAGRLAGAEERAAARARRRLLDAAGPFPASPGSDSLVEVEEDHFVAAGSAADRSS